MLNALLQALLVTFGCHLGVNKRILESFSQIMPCMHGLKNIYPSMALGIYYNSNKSFIGKARLVKIWENRRYCSGVGYVYF